MKISTELATSHAVEIKRPNKGGTVRIIVELGSTSIRRPVWEVRVGFRGYRKHHFEYTGSGIRRHGQPEEEDQIAEIVTEKEIASAILGAWSKLGEFRVHLPTKVASPKDLADLTRAEWREIRATGMIVKPDGRILKIKGDSK